MNFTNLILLYYLYMYVTKYMNKNQTNEINQFISKLYSLEHLNYINIKIESIVRKFFKIINVTPKFLDSFNGNPQYIYMPNFLYDGNRQLFKQIFHNYRDYYLLLLSISYIIEKADFKSVGENIFNEYVVDKYLASNNNIYSNNIDANDTTQYSNIKFDIISKQTFVIPSTSYAFDIQNNIVTALKNFGMVIKLNYHCKIPQSISTKIKNNNFNINISKMPGKLFLLSENIEKIVAYPQEANINWFYSIIKNQNKCPIYMHKYMMKLKGMLKYDDKPFYETLDFYEYAKKYKIPKQQQNILLLTNESKLHVNIYGDIVTSPNFWLFVDTIVVNFNDKIYINIDLHIIAENNKITWDIDVFENMPLFQKYNITPDKYEWILSKLEETDFSTMNICSAMELYRSQLTKVEPIYVTKSFCSLEINKREEVSILKNFLNRYPNICIDENNNFTHWGSKMILDGQPIPTITRITFDIPYCLLCKKIGDNTKITMDYLRIKIKQKPIEQPYFCKKCIRIAQIIKYGKNRSILDIPSHSIHYNGNIIEMMDIKKNITTIILGFKLDNNSTLQYLIYDVIQTIIFDYINSINF